MIFNAIAITTSIAHTIIHTISGRLNGCAIYQVLLSLLPNPLSSMALEITSILSILGRIKGINIVDADLSHDTVSGHPECTEAPVIRNMPPSI